MRKCERVGRRGVCGGRRVGVGVGGGGVGGVCVCDRPGAIGCGGDE